MRSAIAHAAVAAQRAQRRQRSASLSTVPPATTSADYIPELASAAASILYRSPLPSKDGRPIYILNAAAFPDAFEVDYDSLLSYVLARLPGEDELLSGTEYEIIFFAGGQPDNATAEKKQGPGMGWYLQAYHILSRATRKRLQRLYIVHPRTWVRVLIGVFGTIVSPKFRRKIIHVNTLSQLALHIPMETLLIPPTAYLQDRKLSADIYVPFATGKRAFGVRHPFPKNIDTGKARLPRVLRETTGFLLAPACVKMEGIFRIPPNATLAGALKEAYDRGQRFIVWKEPGATVVEPGIDQELVDAVRLEDAYGVHLAASLIKQWYRDLREPLFPESSYETIRERFGSPDTRIRPEDLVDLILPDTDNSPLTKKSRKIITQHLLPMLSEVAAYQSENKMTADNLAICFSMCLVCGSNQMEDAKFAAILTKVLKAAIETWPELRTGMEMSADGFFQDLQPPADLRDYEDPLEEVMPARSAHVTEDDYAIDNRESHRIVLEDSEIAQASAGATMAPQILRGDQMRERAPTLPPRPPSAQNAHTTSASSDGPPAVPKRKPAPPTLEAPPRYSTVFDTDGNSIGVADSPTSYVPVDGFGPPRHGPWSFDEYEKKGFAPEPADPQPAALNMPKRKALSSEKQTPDAANAASSSASTSRAPSFDSEALIQEAAQKAAAATLAQQAAASFAERSPTSPVFHTPTETAAPQLPDPTSNHGSDDSVFRKPSWPASARPIIQPQSLAKPVLPPRQSHTFPLASTSSTNASSTSNGSLTALNVLKHRAPSPGLLKRMNSMEIAGTNSEGKSEGQGGTLVEPRRLDMRKQSVEDLRRLYEERGNLAQGLARAGSSGSRGPTSA